MTAYQLLDYKSTNADAATFVAFDKTERLSANQFVIVESPDSRRYLGIVASAGLNIGRDALDPIDNTSLNQMEMIASGRLSRDVAIKEAWLYGIRLLLDVTEDRSDSVLIRPLSAARASVASDADIVRHLGLPPINQEAAIGTIINSSVPICVSRETMVHHIMVAGTTGSGKSNTIANLLMSSTALGMCNIVWDHKPDYQHAHLPNDEGDVLGRGLLDVHYYAVGRNLGINPHERPINVLSRELDVPMLAATLFYRNGEENQRDAAESLLTTYYNDRARQTSTTLEGFATWVCGFNTAQACPVRVNQQTLNAIQAKINHAGRRPAWIDRGVDRRRGAMWDDEDDAIEPFYLENLIAPGRTIVIRVGSDMNDGRSYGLLLSYILKQVYALKKSRRVVFPINNIIDEAQDIFNAGKAFRDVAETMLDDNVHKGRSLHIGFTICVQAADAIPERILNNLNTRIIHRHNSHDQLRVAADMATDEQRRMTKRFGRGEAFINIMGANSIIHARINRAPFMLTKFEV